MSDYFATNISTRDDLLILRQQTITRSKLPKPNLITRQMRVLSFNSGELVTIFGADRAMIELPIIFMDSGIVTGSVMTTPRLPIYEDDPEILALTEDELRAEVEAAFGSWADREDINDEWLEDLRRGWSVGLDELFNNNSV